MLHTDTPHDREPQVKSAMPQNRGVPLFSYARRRMQTRLPQQDRSRDEGKPFRRTEPGKGVRMTIAADGQGVPLALRSLGPVT